MKKCPFTCSPLHSFDEIRHIPLSGRREGGEIRLSPFSRRRKTQRETRRASIKNATRLWNVRNCNVGALRRNKVSASRPLGQKKRRKVSNFNFRSLKSGLEKEKRAQFDRPCRNFESPVAKFDSGVSKADVWKLKCNVFKRERLEIEKRAAKQTHFVTKMLQSWQKSSRNAGIRRNSFLFLSESAISKQIRKKIGEKVKKFVSFRRKVAVLSRKSTNFYKTSEILGFPLRKKERKKERKKFLIFMYYLKY